MSKHHQHIPRQILMSAYAFVDKMKPLRTRKDPTLAALAGGAFGALGLGLYFGTLADFFVPVGIWIVMAVIAAPTGELLLIGAPVFCAIFGYKRAKSSNARLQHASSGIIEAEIVCDPVVSSAASKQHINPKITLP